ncbi:hypothetical protein [Streptomyces sp. NPDC089919]|uniref:hypothetical protein n=1 Tax=Streptomyces sp. NPDC089919 TaxID=3155188 RepID=UPI00343D3A66
MELWAGIIAVIGTLLGAVSSHVLQSRTADRMRSAALDAEGRRELRQATARLLAAETVFRRLQYDRWGLREAPPTEREAGTAVALQARSDVIAALAEVRLLTGDTEIRRRLDELADATFTLHKAADADDLAARSLRTRDAASALVEAVGRRVRA